jgi:hypothetical protein
MTNNKTSEIAITANRFLSCIAVTFKVSSESRSTQRQRSMVGDRATYRGPAPKRAPPKRVASFEHRHAPRCLRSMSEMYRRRVAYPQR